MLGVVAFAGMMMALGLLGLAAPDRLSALVLRVGGRGLSAVLGIRLLFAALVWWTAPQARHPPAFQAIALLALVSALSLPILGTRRFRAWIEWWAARPPSVARLGAAVLTAFGAFLLWELLR